MINKKMQALGQTGSAIRQLFEYGKERKKLIGEDKVFDFSLGNPNVEAPDIVNETLINLLKYKDSTALHGYTSAVGDLSVRESISEYLNNKYKAQTDPSLIYMTVGAAAALTISLNAILNKSFASASVSTLVNSIYISSVIFVKKTE